MTAARVGLLVAEIEVLGRIAAATVMTMWRHPNTLAPPAGQVIHDIDRHDPASRSRAKPRQTPPGGRPKIRSRISDGRIRM
jgi:hypothetical protein